MPDPIDEPDVVDEDVPLINLEANSPEPDLEGPQDEEPEGVPA